MNRTIAIARERWPLASAFRISRGTRLASEVIVVTIADGAVAGRGECFPYAHYGETLDSVERQINAVTSDIEHGAGRDDLPELMAAGAARNAVDCALWDLDAKRSRCRAWELAGLGPPIPVTTVYTLGVDTPEAMANKARQHRHRPQLKLKMVGDGLDLDRVAAIHRVAPNTGLVVDANEGWTIDQYQVLAPRLRQHGVAMIEQPLPADRDDELGTIARPVPVCADESCHDRSSLPALRGKYDMINIKLDKTGGLSEALALRQEARAAGYGIMVGCMIGTSLAMAPAILIADDARVVDLDGPLLLARDRNDGLVYRDSVIEPSSPVLWG